MRRIVNISMPNMLYVFAQQRAEYSNFGSMSEYVRDLIRRDQQQCEKEKADNVDREARYRRDFLGQHYR